MSFVFAPKGWALCNGQLLPINQNQALFALLGTTFGGDGRVNFALPDLRGRIPIHAGNGHAPGERGGEQAHTLSIPEVPTHTHVMLAVLRHANQSTPAGNLPGDGAKRLSRARRAWPRWRRKALVAAGGSQAHLNMQPFLTLNYCIALQGIFPSSS